MWDRFLQACRGEPVDTTPVWFMRQAGRYLPEYRRLRERYSLLELCRTPELAVEVTLQPVRRLGVDAAILFADLLLPLEPMGAPFEFQVGEGPVVHSPVRTAADVERLRVFDIEEGLSFTLESIRCLRQELDGKTPLIGFAGAPFTLASYLVEGQRSPNHQHTKQLMYTAPEVWHALASKLAEVVRCFLLAQVQAGVQAVQLFDSWVGALCPADYERFVEPYSRAILRGVEASGVPIVHFATGNHSLLGLQRRAGGTVMGVDWRTPLGQAAQLFGAPVPLQGNLDPVLLFAPRQFLEPRLEGIVREGRGLSGHVFNLGHGVLPQTDPDAVRWVVERVHELGER